MLEGLKKMLGESVQDCTKTFVEMTVTFHYPQGAIGYPYSFVLDQPYSKIDELNANYNRCFEPKHEIILLGNGMKVGQRGADWLSFDIFDSRCSYDPTKLGLITVSSLIGMLACGAGTLYLFNQMKSNRKRSREDNDEGERLKALAPRQ